MTSIIAPGQSVSRGAYTRFIQDETGLPHDFLCGLTARIDMAYEVGEPISMICDELKLRFKLRPPRATKTPRALAKRVVKA